MADATPDQSESSEADIVSPRRVPGARPKTAAQRRAETADLLTTADLAKRDAVLRRYIQETARLQREADMRETVSQHLFLLLVCWLSFVAGLLVGNFVAILYGLKGLFDTVLVALMGTTTVGVIGLPASVYRYLFPAEPARRRLPSRRRKSPRGRESVSRRP